jgi:hypothetical protein
MTKVKGKAREKLGGLSIESTLECGECNPPKIFKGNERVLDFKIKQHARVCHPDIAFVDLKIRRFNPHDVMKTKKGRKLLNTSNIHHRYKLANDIVNTN